MSDQPDLIEIRGTGVAADLAALALARFGLRIALAAPTPTASPATVALHPESVETLRRWDITEGLVVAPEPLDPGQPERPPGEQRGNPGLDPHAADGAAAIDSGRRGGGGSIPATLLQEQVQRRLRSFGLLTTDPGSRSAFVLTVGTRQALALGTVGIDDELNLAISHIGQLGWRINGQLCGWYDGGWPSAADHRLPVAVRDAAGGMRFVVLLRAATAAWQSALVSPAQQIPLDLVTVGAGQRLEAAEADPGDEAWLVSPDGFLLRRWPADHCDPGAALRSGLQAVGVRLAADGGPG